MDEQPQSEDPKAREWCRDFTWDDLVNLAIHYGPSARDRLVVVRVDGEARKVRAMHVRKTGKAGIQLELEVEP